MNTNHLEVLLFNTPQEAPHYTAPQYKAADLKTAVIVGRGTKLGNPTVDFVFEDEQGQRYVAMLTAALIENLTGAILGMKKRGET